MWGEKMGKILVTQCETRSTHKALIVLAGSRRLARIAKRNKRREVHAGRGAES